MEMRFKQKKNSFIHPTTFQKPTSRENLAVASPVKTIGEHPHQSTTSKLRGKLH